MSLFALPSRPTVPFNGVSGAQIERLETTQGLQFREDSFSSQRIEFRWTAGSANMWYVPSRSYLRIRFKLGLAAGASIYGPQFTKDDQRSPQIMNEVYLALTDPAKLHGFAAVLYTNSVVSNKFLLLKNVLDLDPVVQADFATCSAELTEAVRNAMRAGITEATSTGRDIDFDQSSTFQEFLTLLKYHTLPAIAPAHAAAANMFSSLTLTYGGQVVSSINSHVAQVDAFDKRTSFTSNAFERDGLGNVNNFYAPDFVDRCAAMTSDYVELLWQPPLAFFRFPHAVPSGDFRLNMTVDPKWKENMFQVVGVNTAGFRLTALDYSLSNMEITMWNHFVQGPSTERAAFVLDLDNISCQAQQSLGEDRLNRQFDISPDTTSIALAHTDMSAGPYLSSRSLFRFPRRRRCQVGDDLTNGFAFMDADALPSSLTAYQILFDGKQWPQQQGDPMTRYQGQDTKARLVQQYHETHSQTGLGYNSCGPETYKQFIDAGLLLYTTWPRANSNATRVQINEELVGAGRAAGYQQGNPIDILLFTKFKRSFLIRIENGRVMRVETAQNTTDATLSG